MQVISGQTVSISAFLLALRAGAQVRDLRFRYFTAFEQPVRYCFNLRPPAFDQSHGRKMENVFYFLRLGGLT